MSDEFPTEFTATVGGHTTLPMVPELEAELRAHILSFKEGETVKVIIKRFFPKNSKKQRGALFGLAYSLIGEYMGERDREEIHRICIAEFRNQHGGWLSRKKTRLKKMDTREAAEYFDWLQEFGAALGVDIPDPDANWRERTKEVFG